MGEESQILRKLEVEALSDHPIQPDISGEKTKAHEVTVTWSLCSIHIPFLWAAFFRL